MLLDLKRLRYGDDATRSYSERPAAHRSRLTSGVLWPIVTLILVAILAGTIWLRFLRGPNAALPASTLIPSPVFPVVNTSPPFRRMETGWHSYGMERRKTITTST